MGVAIIGGLISSTILTLVVVPAIFHYVERFRHWSLAIAQKAVSDAPSEQKTVSH